MARTKAKRKHQVDVTLKAFGISKAGTSLDLEIYSEGEKIGHLTIGRGSIGWRGGKRKRAKSFRWEEFAEWMDERVYGRPRARPTA
jgi:hypothetical protein